MPGRCGVIINADDFGISEQDNRWILEGLQTGVLTSTTLMANMPAFEEACALASTHRLQGRIGLHFNLTYGRSLSERIRRCPRFCDALGEFRPGLSAWTPRLTVQEAEAVRDELRAQWRRCVKAGVLPSHIDSHQHIHTLWPVGAVVAQEARMLGVPVRQARNLGTNLHPVKRVYKTLFNMRLRQSAVTTDWTCTPRDLLQVRLPRQGYLEIIAHPSRSEQGIYTDEMLGGRSLVEVLDTTLTGWPRLSFSEMLVQRRGIGVLV